MAQYQQSLQSFLLGLPPRRRFWLGLFASAALAQFAPLVVFAAVGQWVNQVMAFVTLAVAILLWMLINLLGNKIKQVWLVNGLVAFALEMLTVWQMMHQYNNVWQGLAAWWTSLVGFAVVCALNAALFLHYKRIAELP
jgi:putative effector of murein hydrolase